MQITEQLIERIARRVFNSMFAPALRQSNVQGGGTSGSVRYADEAGHAASADEVAWTGVSGKPSFATVATSGSYNDLSNKPSIPSVSGSVSGSTLTITINGSRYSLTDTNTWRPVQNNLDSTAIGDSLSAYQGYLLARGYARDSTKLPLAGGTITGNLTVNQMFTCQSVEIGHTNEINATGSSNLYLQYRNSGNLVLCYNGHNVGIGTDSPSYKLHVAGVIYSSTGVYSEGYVTALSDARKKDIQGDINLSVEDVASAPAIKFLWKQNRDAGMQAGTIAQYWQSVLPEAVQDHDGELSMSYGVTALMSSIATAKKVVDHERRISELERENELLKKTT